MIDMLASLGINPLFAVIMTLWALSYVIALRLLIEGYRRTKDVSVGFWLLLALFIPVGQIFTIIYLCQAGQSHQIILNTEAPRTPRIIRKYANKGRNVGAIL